MQLRQSFVISLGSTLTLAAALVLVGCGGGADIEEPSFDANVPGIDAGPDARTECPDPEPAPEACDFFLSCGCNVAAGEKCTINIASQVKACFQAGPKAPGEACTGENDCAAGSVCALFGDGGGKRCMQFCDDAHACPSQQACYLPVVSAVDAKVCGQICDLRAQDCEVANQGCYPASIVSTDEKGICAVAGAGTQGDACTLGNDCAEGFTCSDTDDKCHQLCNREGGAPTCTTGTCNPLAGNTATGICE